MSNDCACQCGCLGGKNAEILTPVNLEQRPGLTALAYRVGTHGRFKKAMLASISQHPELKPLTTRADDDPAIALLDACAVMLDVLTFYQERIAGEGYLRTALERRSILELARAIGYELSPGVAATAYLAFTVEDAPGSPGYAVINKGTKVQSVPGPLESAQIFETTEKITAHKDWNQLKPKLTQCAAYAGQQELYLKGTNVQLSQGDILLIVGDERAGKPASNNWDVRIVASATPEKEKGWTVVRWQEGLGHHNGAVVEPARENVKVYAFRQRAAFFGHNAPDLAGMKYLAPGSGMPEVWTDYALNTTQTGPYTYADIHLDNAYPKILAGSWVVFSIPEYMELYRVTEVYQDSRCAFTLHGKTTRLSLMGENMSLFHNRLRDTTVYAQSEELALAGMPFRTPEREGSPSLALGQGALTPVDGTKLTLDRVVPGLTKGQRLIISGKRLRLRSLVDIFGLHTGAILAAGSVLQVAARPVYQAGVMKMLVKNPTHFTDRIEISAAVSPTILMAEYMPAADDDPTVSEVLTLEAVDEVADSTVLYFKEALENIYDRATVSLTANCARATHGESRFEILGSGDASQAFQVFTLKQTPLTYEAASTPQGGLSTLEVRVNDVLWQEVATLYGQDAKARVYTTRLGEDGKVCVLFGDGITGSRLPTGTENISAAYRVGTGLAGMVKAGQLSMLMTRPLGLKAVTNPQAAGGANDPESGQAARRNAPFTVLTFDRIVTLKDYEDFALRFSGIGKAQSTWLWDGARRFVHLTIAAAGGGAVEGASELFKNLNDAIRTWGLPHQHFLVQSFTPLAFTLKAKVRVDGTYLSDTVLAAVYQALIDRFSFAARSFGQWVAASEVIALMQGIEGVAMVDLDFLKQGKNREPVLVARKAWWDRDLNEVNPAELLLIDHQGIDLVAL